MLEIYGVQFVAHGATHRFTSTRNRFCLVKRPDLVDRYQRLLDDTRPSAAVEVGVYQGGSCGLMALAADPDVLVAVELDEERVPALDALIAERGWGDRVHVHHGVDQADGARLNRLVDGHLAGRPARPGRGRRLPPRGPDTGVVQHAVPAPAPGRHHHRGLVVGAHWLRHAPTGGGTAHRTGFRDHDGAAVPPPPHRRAADRPTGGWSSAANAEVDAGFDIPACYFERGRALLASPAG